MTEESIIYQRALAIARGDAAITIDIVKIFARRLDVTKIKLEFLPGPKTISGQPAERKSEILRLAQRLWYISPDEWLASESRWLSLARISSGSQETGGKDNLDDLVAPELLIRLLATIRFVSMVGQEPELKEEAMNALDLVLNEAVAKGRTRINRIEGKTHYAVLKCNGIMIGTGGGKYLPSPETSLPILFSLLDKSVINPEAYR